MKQTTPVSTRILCCSRNSIARGREIVLGVGLPSRRDGGVSKLWTMRSRRPVSAFNGRLEVGCEVIIQPLDRGVPRASVTMTCANKECTSKVLAQATFTGRCQRQQF